jgi:arylsulfatase A-like enzyme
VGMDSWLDQDAEGSGSVGGAFGIRKRASIVNDETLRWIDRDRQRPFFVFLNYFDVHSPYGGPRTYPKPEWKQAGSTELPLKDRPLIDKYDDGVKYVDDFIGQLMKQLEQRGLMGNTLVVITSDHGESLEQHGLPYHGHGLYRELIRVPLIFWYPGHIPGGVRVTAPVTNSAIPATVADVLGWGAEGGFRGPGLDAAWNGQAMTDWPSPLSELSQNIFLTKQDKGIDPRIPTAVSGPMKSMATAQWHLIVHEKLGEQVYEWERDPGEIKDLIDTPEGRAAAAELRARIDALVRK